MLELEIKNRITTAMKSGDDLEKNLFRVVLGDAQMAAYGAAIDDKIVVGVVKKIIASLKETIRLGNGIGREMAKEEKELTILGQLLPQTWSQQTIEAFLLNSDNPEFEAIQEAKTDGQAMGIAMRAFKAAGCPVEADNVRVVVSRIRSI